MRITALEWHEENIEHIARHQVDPDEVEELCFSHPYIETGRDGLYYVTGQALSGRYLMAVVKQLGRGKAEVITARAMNEMEKSRYRRKRGL